MWKGWKYKNELGEIYVGKIKIFNVMGIVYCIVGLMYLWNLWIIFIML